MNPTLQPSDLLEIEPGGGDSVLPGDVVLFLPPGYSQAVVHRVIRRTPAGIVTRGDNNDHDDPWPLQPADILGRVISSRRGVAQRPIQGGRSGLILAYLMHGLGVLDRVFSQLLHPFYHGLASSQVVYRLTSKWVRPRLVVFSAGDAHRVCLLLQHRVIGQYNSAERCWHIRRPFRLWLTPDFLAKPVELEGSFPAAPRHRSTS